MTNLLLRLFLPGGCDPESPQTRQRCGALAGWTGILLNALLFLGKLFSGLTTHSIAVIADAVNNLSDAASSVVTLIGFRMAGMEADEDHPFGHGRIEYLTGLFVAVAILLMGLEVGRSSIVKLFHPEELSFSWPAVIILAAAILIKLWLYCFNRSLSRLIHSEAMAATAADSLSDVLSTSVVLLATLVGHYTDLKIDGMAGLLVAAFILKTGWDSARETLNPLLGRPMDPDLAAEIDKLVVDHPYIMGIHDLIYHDYGPGRAMMSFHAEVPAEESILVLHDMIDHIEQELKARHHIETVIHMDPVVRDEHTAALRRQVAQLAGEIDPRMTIHDFRVVPGPTHTNLIFDLLMPYQTSITPEQALQAMTEGIQRIDPHYCPVIQVDHPYVDSREREK